MGISEATAQSRVHTVPPISIAAGEGIHSERWEAPLKIVFVFCFKSALSATGAVLYRTPSSATHIGRQEQIEISLIQVQLGLY